MPACGIDSRSSAPPPATDAVPATSAPLPQMATGAKPHAWHVAAGRTTLPRAKVAIGNTVRCHGSGASVPPPGHGVEGFSDYADGSAVDLSVTTTASGDVIVDCRVT